MTKLLLKLKPLLNCKLGRSEALYKLPLVIWACYIVTVSNLIKMRYQICIQRLVQAMENLSTCDFQNWFVSLEIKS